MAQQYVGKSVPAYLNGDFTPAIISGFTNDSVIPVRLDDSNNADGIPTIGIADATNSVVYGKLDVAATNWDALGEPTVDSNGNVTYPNMGAAIVSGIIEFSVASAIAPGDIGKGIEGAASNNVAAAATGGTGKIVARQGTTIWVDLRA